MPNRIRPFAFSHRLYRLRRFLSTQKRQTAGQSGGWLYGIGAVPPPENPVIASRHEKQPIFMLSAVEVATSANASSQ